MSPDPGPLELYQQVFPWRTVYFDPLRQLWRIWDGDRPGELLFEWGFADPTTGEPLTQDDLEVLARKGDHRVRRAFVPFDYRYVNQRLKDYWWLLRLGAEKNSDRISTNNRTLARQRVRSLSREMAAGMKEFRRWWPVLASVDMQAHTWDGADVRTPLIAVGTNLSGG